MWECTGWDKDGQGWARVHGGTLQFIVNITPSHPNYTYCMPPLFSNLMKIMQDTWDFSTSHKLSETIWEWTQHGRFFTEWDPLWV